ncbi:ABC transporter permease [Segetibacter sp. 3557_3]|uniref:MlaE family ABC transporter permease n=1 Tax=Segetibacter sp. 3557_3 TaxID=2547429 RepID=UPI00105863A3|nr:ABC transporter permease [Segetibacter sp. 3557_3]TDH28772.1 ABC transporter permease [Segetibacter sp. 3557_3]
MFGKFFYTLGAILLMLKDSFSAPENRKLYWQQFMVECTSIGIGSLPIVAIISVFLGMVMTIQTSYQLVSPLVPKTIIAGVVRDSVVLELSPTVVCIVLAGVVGSRIASELGNMRVSEQVDAYEIMGINTKAYLILPKIVASILMFPVLILISITLSLVGGAIAGTLAGIISLEIYQQGLVNGFKGFTIAVAMVKSVAFATSISLISCYNGYFVRGGSLEIGRASTKAVVVSCVAILVFDYIITALML